MIGKSLFGSGGKVLSNQSKTTMIAEEYWLNVCWPICLSVFYKLSIIVSLMSEQEQEKKKRKKKRLSSLETERTESELFPELMKGLEELEKESKYVDIQVCPKCKGTLVRRVGSMTGDMSAHMGWTPTVLKATNRPTRVRDVVMMAEAKDAESERRRKETK
jgi:hypothetical protein